MCNRLSNAERTDGRREDTGSARALWAQRSEQQMIQQAYRIGPSTAWFIQRLWDHAALEAYWQGLEVFQYAHRYSPERVERATTRAMSHGIADLDGLRLIFAYNLDSVSECQDGDVFGQLLLPFLKEPRT